MYPDSSSPEVVYPVKSVSVNPVIEYFSSKNSSKNPESVPDSSEPVSVIPLVVYSLTDMPDDVPLRIE